MINQLEASYAEMAKDKKRESDALIWAEATIKDSETMFITLSMDSSLLSE
jgi:hypothetical protein